MSWPCARARKLFVCVTRLMVPGRLFILQRLKIFERLFLSSSASHIMPSSVINMDTLINPKPSPSAAHQQGACICCIWQFMTSSEPLYANSSRYWKPTVYGGQIWQALMHQPIFHTQL